jgi:uncharacterized membrane protein (UPF0127 family)
MESTIVVARGLARLRGLIGRHRWPAAVALEIPRCRSVHTFGMRFALDLVWLDRDRRVVRVDRRVPPWRVRSCRAARSVLELRASGCAQLGAWMGALEVREGDGDERLGGRGLPPAHAPDERDRPGQLLRGDRPQLDRRPSHHTA